MKFAIEIVFQLVLNLLSLKVILANVAYYGPYSSCQIPTNWTKGSGPVIRSWLRSIVPLLPDSPTDIYATPAGLIGTFTRTYSKEYVKEISNSATNLTWRIHGKGKFDGWLYGTTIEGQFTGDNIAYIYQDLTTAIVGTFDHGKLVAGKAARIKAYRCRQGIMELEFSKPKADSVTFTYERLTETFITSQMTAMDPHDYRHVFVNNSTLKNLTNGDGLFAKRFIPAHSLVAIYAGFFINVNHSIFYDNMTMAEKEESHKNLMSYNDTFNLNLPPELTSVVDYRATLGHKVNNALKDARNTEFCFIKHPRFGHCRCIRSFKAIAKGEEIFIDYGYDVNEESAPGWYKQLYKETYGTEGTADEDTAVEANDDDNLDGGRE